MFPLSKAALEFQHGRYRHYKGNEYQTHFIARQENTHEEVVVYQDLADPSLVWCRPLSAFLERVDVSGEKVPRFERLI